MGERSLLVWSLTILTAASGFALLGPLARFAYDLGLEPFSFVAWRAAFGTAIVAALVAVRLRRGSRFVPPWRVPRRQGLAFAVAASAAILLNVSVFFAFGLTSVALVLIGFYTYPAMVAVVAVVRGHEPLDAGRALALLLASLGMVLVVAGGLDPAVGVRVDPLGIGLALVAALCQTVFMTISRGSYPAIPTDQAMGWIMAITVVVCAILAVVLGSAGNLIVPITSAEAFGLSAAAGILAAGLPSVAFLTGIRAIGGTRTGILMLFEPVVGVALAALWLDERIVPIQLAGGVAVLAAALLVQRSGGGIGAAATPIPAAGRTIGSERRLGEPPA